MNAPSAAYGNIYEKVPLVQPTLSSNSSISRMNTIAEIKHGISMVPQREDMKTVQNLVNNLNFGTNRSSSRFLERKTISCLS